MKAIAFLTSLILSTAPAIAQPIQAGVSVECVRLDQNAPVLDVSERRRRKVIIDWYPWHCEFARLLESHWHHLYDSLGRFPTPPSRQGLLRLTFTPNGIQNVELVQSSGSQQLDFFEMTLYKLAGTSNTLVYPIGTRRRTFAYTVPFQAEGAINTPMQYHKVMPMQDVEVYYE